MSRTAEESVVENVILGNPSEMFSGGVTASVARERQTVPAESRSETVISELEMAVRLLEQDGASIDEISKTLHVSAELVNAIFNEILLERISSGDVVPDDVLPSGLTA
jgi:hypothetical protein